MEKLNGLDVPSHSGYRKFEVFCGNITDISNYDVLFVSAFNDDYQPTSHSLIGDLDQKLSISVAELSHNRMIDVSGTIRFWIAQMPAASPFRFLVCLESGEANYPCIIRSAFQAVNILEAHGEKIFHIVLPILASGDQGIRTDQIIDPLRKGAEHLLKTSQTVELIQFVELNRNKALELSATLDANLGRQLVALPNTPLTVPLREELDQYVAQAQQLGLPTDLAALLRQNLLSPETASHDIGVAGRRLVEFVAKNVLGTPKAQKSGDLFSLIEKLRDKSVSTWVTSYMHTLRVFGNEGAHHKEAGKRIPPGLDQEDLIACLVCVQRVLSFWLIYQQERFQTPPAEAK